MKKRLILFFLPLFLVMSSSAWMNVFASATFYWDGGAGTDNWLHADNWDCPECPDPNTLPAYDGDVVIDGNVNVILYAPAYYTIESVVLDGGATLTIADGATLNTRKGGNPGSNGFRLDGASGEESTLIVNGTLNINNHIDQAPRDGLDINKYSSVIVGPAGSLNITLAGEHGIEISDGLVNYGSILITGSSGMGIFSDSGVSNSLIENYGSIIISGGTAGIYLNNRISLVNYIGGTVKLSGTSGKLIDGFGSFLNNGTLSGNGIVNAADYVNGAGGATIAPGTSVGVLQFDGNADFSGAILDFEIAGAASPGSDYDLLIVDGSLNLSGATLSLSGAHIPSIGNVITIIDKTSSGPITGAFSGLPEGAAIELNGYPMTISYVGGTGNDVTLSFGAFPVELIGFEAKPDGKGVKLSWSTASESNNDYFAIEHSQDGKNFSEIGRVYGAGNSVEVKQYAFLHQTPAAGINYYRLHQFDFDGSSDFSKVESVLFEGPQAWFIRQTLAHDFLTIEWPAAGREEAVTLEIFNLAGQAICRQAIAPGLSAWSVPVNGWQPGVYIARLHAEGLPAQAQRFVLQ